VLVGIAGAFSAVDSAIEESYGWMVFWILVSGGALFFAYWLMKD
jgi:hypothetical protein